MLRGAARRALFGEIRSNKINEYLTRAAPNLFRQGKAESGFRSFHRRFKPKRPVHYARNLQLDRPVRHESETDSCGYELTMVCFSAASKTILASLPAA